ncbi:hypothetical protein F2Q65_09385 [Thiohalocapsa marina]|uniref:Transposase n=1 Tax=Thiohalocapsa marina TaxID=424902 RepID=A0A5M8FSL8_9GAMM|nr:hypothetical protein [Thiohalocapsa marina]KAA6185302.1 hypothetical protein F2Q65_09385 [Thiohalocapsa marina]
MITVRPAPAQARACRDQGVEPQPITLRLVRVTLNGGDTEVLATTVLEEARLPARLFKALYHRRWGAEEGYKTAKLRAEMETLSGRTALAVRQDMQAKVLAMNLAAMLRAVAQVRFYAVVRDKTALATYVQQQNVRDPAYRYRQNEQYDLLVKELFDKLHHMANHVRICFARRGTKPRNDAFRTALKQAAVSFAQNFGFAHPATNEVISSTPPKCPGLQAVDY